LHGLTLPVGVFADWKAVDAQLRYAIKAQLSDGRIEGAVLTFTLQREPEGFRPVGMAMEPLSEAERAGLTGCEADEAPFPLLPLGEVYPELSQIAGLLKAGQDQITGDGGWIHWVVEESGQPETSPQLLRRGSYDLWWLVDGQDLVIAWLAVVEDADGKLSAVVRAQNNYVDSLDNDGDGPMQPAHFPAVLNLMDDLVQQARTGKEIEQVEAVSEGRRVLVFTFREPYDPPVIKSGVDFAITERIEQYTVDAESGAYLSHAYYWGAEDGRRVLSSELRLTVQERVDRPPDEVLALFEEPLPAGW
jgi:hypothetical protein